MDYPETVEQAAEFVRLALPLMTQHSVPANPINYAVWYEYVAGRNPDLKQRLDESLRLGRAIDAEYHKSLYRQFLADGNEAAVEELRTGVRRLLSETLSQIGESGGQAAHYGRVLESYSGQLERKLDLDEMRKLIGMLITETKAMEYSNTLLEERLKATTRDLEAIRKELEHAKQEATTDALTGIANRKAFDDSIRTATEEAASSQRPLCLLLGDIDHFKRFNDTHGHLLGDKLLRFVATNLKQCTKGKDLVARYGGEEFAILLPDTPLGGARAAAENIRALLESQRLRKRESKESVGSVTLSIGVSCYRPGEPLEAFIQRADAALYHAKHNGRNRVISEDALGAHH